MVRALCEGGLRVEHSSDGELGCCGGAVFVSCGGLTRHVRAAEERTGDDCACAEKEIEVFHH